MNNIDWSDGPPPDAPSTRFELRRVGTQPTLGFSTMEKPLGVNVHYHRGRTKPHYQSGTCEACADGNTPRWKGYLTLYDPRTRDHWLQEFTPAAYDGLLLGIKAHGSLRGHQICFRRTRMKINAPLKSEVYVATIDLRTLPEAPDVVAILHRIWDIPLDEEHPSTNAAIARHTYDPSTKEPTNGHADQHKPEPTRDHRKR